MTHRMFSRNSASSRAIPVKKFRDDVVNNPVIPTHWGANQKGMQAGEELVARQERDARYKAWIAVEANATLLNSAQLFYLRAIDNKSMNETHKSLVLCSGGLDSVIVAAKLKSEGKDVTLLYINYGNQNYLSEVRAVYACALEMRMMVRVLQFADTLWQNTPMTSARADRGLKGQQAHVPGRNMVLLAIAAGFAATDGFDSVAIGNVADGTDGDNKVEFTNRFDAMLEYATAPYASVKCLAPIVHLTKAEGVKLGASLKVPFELTWSCYRSKGDHCGDCDGCINRRNSFTKAGVADPTRYLTVSK